MEQKPKIKCKAHHFVWEGDDPVGRCKYCGAMKKQVTFDEITSGRSFSQGRSSGGAGIRPIEHSAVKISIRDIINR